MRSYEILKRKEGKVSASRGHEYENGCLRWCCTVKSARYCLTFRRCFLPPLSGHHSATSQKTTIFKRKEISSTRLSTLNPKMKQVREEYDVYIPCKASISIKMNCVCAHNFRMYETLSVSQNALELLCENRYIVRICFHRLEYHLTQTYLYSSLNNRVIKTRTLWYIRYVSGMGA